LRLSLGGKGKETLKRGEGKKEEKGRKGGRKGVKLGFSASLSKKNLNI